MWNIVCEVWHFNLIWTNSLNLQLRICLCVKDTQSVRAKQMDVWHAESADSYSASYWGTGPWPVDILAEHMPEHTVQIYVLCAL